MARTVRKDRIGWAIARDRRPDVTQDARYKELVKKVKSNRSKARRDAINKEKKTQT
jgi:hypothetical protein